MVLRKTSQEDAAMGDFPTRILLATDGSEGADLAASRAAELAQRTDSELHVVHVGQAPAFLMGDPGTRGYRHNRMLLEEIEDEARERLRKLSWRVKVAGGEVAGVHLRMGEVGLEIVGLEIVGLAKKLGADLIVMGCRGRRGVRRAVGGSVSDAVIRNAPCPVLVARSHEGVEGPAILQESR
jgi:nucleotide-binding universal stress UspA family protein